MRRGIAAAEQERAAVLLEINTFGGLLAAAAEIRDAVVRARVPVISYVTDRAWSAGAHCPQGTKDCHGPRQQYGRG